MQKLSKFPKLWWKENSRFWFMSNKTNQKTKNQKTENMLTMLKSDPEALAKDLLEAFSWILAQINLVHTNTINKVLTVNPITVITKFMPEDIIFMPSSTISTKKKTSFRLFCFFMYWHYCPTNPRITLSVPLLQIPDEFFQKSCCQQKKPSLLQSNLKKIASFSLKIQSLCWVSHPQDSL